MLKGCEIKKRKKRPCCLRNLKAEDADDWDRFHEGGVEMLPPSPVKRELFKGQ